MKSLIPPFDAYRGDAPYIFVSYAHKNADAVFGHITRLREEGFRIWYDEGIDPGADWSDEIATALANAEVFLVFVSNAAVASNNVRKEIVFAIDQKKYMLCVHIEETELPAGLKMQLGDIQALLEDRFHDKKKFYERFFAALRPEMTRGEEYGDAPVRFVPQKAAPTAGNRLSLWKQYKKPLLMVLGLAFVGLAAFGGFTLTQKGPEELVFSDRNLELALRDALQKPRGPLVKTDFVSFNGRLDLSGRNITDITSLQYMVGISMLNLEGNAITDIAPLGSLQGIMVLGLGNNTIREIAALKNLGPSLIGLSLEGNPVRDLMQLRTLTNLEVLDLSGVPITDLELGRYLRRLKSLSLTESGHGLDAENLWKFKANLPPNCTVTIDPGRQ